MDCDLDACFEAAVEVAKEAAVVSMAILSLNRLQYSSYENAQNCLYPTSKNNVYYEIKLI